LQHWFVARRYKSKNQFLKRFKEFAKLGAQTSPSASAGKRYQKLLNECRFLSGLSFRAKRSCGRGRPRFGKGAFLFFSG